ncbi:MarR family winged helix-turn-helix transcriptional regulator [Tsukamurella spumae]|uniref:MarR family transcriptional regulator n=1 Tax=Tsukamurella spumae TaxID=44753 RepID=A0A846X510_9ACTN|nr:MarR family transcriptional regulator [Tsukamurella spumae]NKY20171.1 MarR family transcriptional regulator [Tsukamurella spumae]
MSRPGYELPLLLLSGFRAAVDEAHRILAEQGFPEARPRDGFAMQAVGHGSTAREIAATLGVSKQAAAKTITRLVDLNYVRVDHDPDDGRRRLVTPTTHGRAMLHASAMAFHAVRDTWAQRIGTSRLDAMLDDLASLTASPIRLDTLAALSEDAADQ